MPETVRSIESFAWEGGMVHDGTVFPADAEVVARFPHFFAQPEPVPTSEPAQPVKRAPGRPRKAVSRG